VPGAGESLADEDAALVVDQNDANAASKLTVTDS
jgi:hypothetical protein